MDRFLWPLSFAVLWMSGCTDLTASLPMSGAARDGVLVDGQRYLVSHTTARAEATRLSYDPDPDTLKNIDRAARAMQQVSGCAIRSGTLYGDTVMAEALLVCPDGRPAVLAPEYRFDPPGQG